MHWTIICDFIKIFIFLMHSIQQISSEIIIFLVLLFWIICIHVLLQLVLLGFLIKLMLNRISTISFTARSVILSLKLKEKVEVGRGERRCIINPLYDSYLRASLFFLVLVSGWKFFYNHMSL